MVDTRMYPLPEPPSTSAGGLTAILKHRRTIRAFAPQPVSPAEISQLLWAAQGTTSRDGLRTAPSAGALYPLQLHLVAGDVAGLPAGHYRYVPAQQALTVVQPGDLRPLVANAALDQTWVAEAAAIVVVAAVDSRTTSKYGPRGVRYVTMEVGHASQNLLLQAVALGLGAAVVGAFEDARLKRLLRLPDGEHPLAILPLGHPRERHG
jgi:SagB-type dehydrogenase family enzyme